MAKLIYEAIMSLDGYIADAGGNFEWTVPDEEVHAFINDLGRSVGTHLYGRRTYEMMIGSTSARSSPCPPLSETGRRPYLLMPGCDSSCWTNVASTAACLPAVPRAGDYVSR